MNNIDWLLENADPALEYQVRIDLMKENPVKLVHLQKEMLKNGWVADLVARKKPGGHWGNSVYNPKWTCSHYVLFELYQLGAPADFALFGDAVALLLDNPEGEGGGKNYARTIEYSDVCINGMILTIASYFHVNNKDSESIIDYLIKVIMPDEGWNCAYLQGASRSSLHTTISVIEGLWQYLTYGGRYRADEIRKSVAGAVEFIQRHELFKSVTTGEIIKDEFFKYAFPVRWKYDIMRCLDLFRKNAAPYDPRMEDALVRIEKSANKAGRWKAAVQAGKTYFIVEKPGTESKWNTLRAMRILDYYRKD